MSSSFFVRYIASIVEEKRPKDINFPKEIYVDETYQVESQEQLREVFNNRFRAMVQSPGLVVMKDQNAIVDMTGLNFDQRIFVPWHMITHFYAEVTRLAVVEKKVDDLLPEPPKELPKETVN